MLEFNNVQLSPALLTLFAVVVSIGLSIQQIILSSCAGGTIYGLALLALVALANPYNKSSLALVLAVWRVAISTRVGVSRQPREMTK